MNVNPKFLNGDYPLFLQPLIRHAGRTHLAPPDSGQRAALTGEQSVGTNK